MTVSSASPGNSSSPSIGFPSIRQGSPSVPFQPPVVHCSFNPRTYRAGNVAFDELCSSLDADSGTDDSDAKCSTPRHRASISITTRDLIRKLLHHIRSTSKHTWLSRSSSDNAELPENDCHVSIPTLVWNRSLGDFVLDRSHEAQDICLSGTQEWHDTSNASEVEVQDFAQDYAQRSDIGDQDRVYSWLEELEVELDTCWYSSQDPRQAKDAKSDPGLASTGNKRATYASSNLEGYREVKRSKTSTALRPRSSQPIDTAKLVSAASCDRRVRCQHKRAHRKDRDSRSHDLSPCVTVIEDSRNSLSSRSTSLVNRESIRPASEHYAVGYPDPLRSHPVTNCHWDSSFEGALGPRRHCSDTILKSQLATPSTEYLVATEARFFHATGTRLLQPVPKAMPLRVEELNWSLNPAMTPRSNSQKRLTQFGWRSVTD